MSGGTTGAHTIPVSGGIERKRKYKTAGVKKGKFAAEQVSLCYFCSSRVADHLRPEGLPGWIPDFEGRVCVQFYSQEEVDDKNTVSARG